MNGIDKLRRIVDWANSQSEYVNEKFKTIKGLEKAFDYATANNLEFIDDDYLLDNCTEEEIKKHEYQLNKFTQLI